MAARRWAERQLVPGQVGTAGGGCWRGKSGGTLGRMDDGLVGSLSNEELLAARQDLVRRSCEMEADLLVHLGRSTTASFIAIARTGRCTRSVRASSGSPKERPTTAS